MAPLNQIILAEHVVTRMDPETPAVLVCLALATQIRFVSFYRGLKWPEKVPNILLSS